jgi:hypothetical protein
MKVTTPGGPNTVEITKSLTFPWNSDLDRARRARRAVAQHEG